MTQLTFGTKNQIVFNAESELFETLGFLAKSDGSSGIVWENNQDQGAWGSEGRIKCYNNISSFPVALRNAFTAGVGNIVHRINCNEFIEYIVRNHAFGYGDNQDAQAIRNTIPSGYKADFDRGYNI
jgi:hypothetical protein